MGAGIPMNCRTNHSHKHVYIYIYVNVYIYISEDSTSKVWMDQQQRNQGKVVICYTIGGIES